MTNATFLDTTRQDLYKYVKNLITQGKLEKNWDFKGQIFAGTRPLKSSKSVNIGPKCIFYSAFNRKQIAILYSGI